MSDETWAEKAKAPAAAAEPPSSESAGEEIQRAVADVMKRESQDDQLQLAMAKVKTHRVLDLFEARAIGDYLWDLERDENEAEHGEHKEMAVRKHIEKMITLQIVDSPTSKRFDRITSMLPALGGAQTNKGILGKIGGMFGGNR